MASMSDSLGFAVLVAGDLLPVDPAVEPRDVDALDARGARRAREDRERQDRKSVV